MEKKRTFHHCINDWWMDIGWDGMMNLGGKWSFHHCIINQLCSGGRSTMNGGWSNFPSHQYIMQWWKSRFSTLNTCMIIQVLIWKGEGSSFHPILYPSINHLYNGWKVRFSSMNTCMIIQVPVWMVEGSSFNPILYPSINDLYNGGDSAFIPWILVWSFKFY
jgi:hypothetical protein